MNLEIKHVAKADVTEKSKIPSSSTLITNTKYPLVYFALSILFLIISIGGGKVVLFDEELLGFVFFMTSLGTIFTSWITIKRSAYHPNKSYVLLVPLAILISLNVIFYLIYYLVLTIKVIWGHLFNVLQFYNLLV